MKKIMIFFVFAAIILLLVFPIHADEVKNLSEPDAPGPYHIGYYRVSYNIPPMEDIGQK